MAARTQKKGTKPAGTPALPVSIRLAFAPAFVSRYIVRFRSGDFAGPVFPTPTEGAAMGFGKMMLGAVLVTVLVGTAWAQGAPG